MLLPLLVAINLASEPSATLTFDAFTTNPEMIGLMRFQNIDSYKLKFEGEALNGKTYEIRIKKFENGKKTQDRMHLDASELGSLGKVSAGELNLELITQAKDGKAKIEFQTPRFGSAWSYEATETKHSYVTKNFLGGENKMTFNPTKETYFLAMLQPTVHPDGSTSYCEVAQSGLDPEKLFEKFKVPTYFLFSIKFK